MADWTKPNKEISALLKKLGSKQIPVLAIFPAKNPNQPIVMRGLYTQADVIEKLEQAGPSKTRRPPAGPPGKPHESDRTTRQGKPHTAPASDVQEAAFKNDHEKPVARQ